MVDERYKSCKLKIEKISNNLLTFLTSHPACPNDAMFDNESRYCCFEFVFFTSPVERARRRSAQSADRRGADPKTAAVLIDRG
jgi:hypothetical protein